MKKITLLLFTILPLLGFGQNLAPNPTLNGNSNWSDLSPGTSQAYDGSFTRTADASGSWIINSSGGYNSGIKSDNISGINAGEYVFSYYVYGTVGDKTKPIIRDNGTSTNIQGVVYTIQADNTWEFVQETFTMSGTGTVNLRAMVNKNDASMDFHVDDFSFSYIPPTGNTLTVNTVGAGSVALTLDQISYDPADVETLTATASTHWSFDSWSVDLTGNTNPETLLMDADRTVDANFTVDPTFDYDFTFDADGELEGWTMDPQVSVTSHTGGLVTLSITADQWSRLNLFDFPIPATTIGPDGYNKVTVILKNEEPTTDQFAVTLGPNNNTNVYPLASQGTFQTLEIDLTQFVDWTGDIESFRIRFADEDNPTNTGRPSVSHDVVIDSVVFSFDATLSVDDVDYKDDASLTLYPNPVNDVLKINSPFAIEKVEVFNLLGQKTISTQATRINTSELAKGMYIIKITQENDVISTKRFIKQ